MKRLFTKKKIIIFLLVLVLSIGLGLAYAKTRSKNSTEPGSGQTINYEPATDEEKQQASDTKDQVIERTKNEQGGVDEGSATQNSKKTIKPIITQTDDFDNRVNISAYIPGIFEEGGTCTAVLSKNGAQVSTTSKAFGNVSTTNCIPMHIPRDQFPSSGDWTVVVSYNSEKSSGSSDNATVRIDP